jgi:FkbM family methyltransferase
MNVRGLGHVVVVPAAAGASDGMGTLALRPMNCQSALTASKPNALTEGGAAETRVRVRVVRVDGLHFPGRVAFVKIDVEGGERAAFRGMRRVLSLHRPVVVFEDHTGDNAAYLHTVHGYSIARINRSNFIATPNG